MIFATSRFDPFSIAEDDAPQAERTLAVIDRLAVNPNRTGENQLPTRLVQDSVTQVRNRIVARAEGEREGKAGKCFDGCPFDPKSNIPEQHPMAKDPAQRP